MTFSDVLYFYHTMVTLDELNPYTQSDADKAFQTLCTLDTEIVWGPPGEKHFKGSVREMQKPTSIFTPVPASLAASGFYHWANRMRCGHQSSPSPASLLECLRPSSENTSIVRKALRSANYQACQFNPAVALTIIKELTPSKGAKVLDPCAGWGDRLAGAAACSHVSEYTGFDPNTSLVSGYREQIINYGKVGIFNVMTMPFEDAPEIPPHFDLVFTSPPYFDTERYCDEPTQSCIRHPELHQWVPRFFKPMLVKAANAVRGGGYFALNVANVLRRGKLVPLPDFAFDIFEGMPDWSFRYCWGLVLSHKKTCEPILVWQKKG